MSGYGNQPPSFKTDVHRAPTKKWVTAPSYGYDGDDWGGYDEYDEYDSYAQQPPVAAKPTGLRQRGQEPSTMTQAHSSTTSVPRRQQSFNAGDDTRNFSAPVPSHSQHPSASSAAETRQYGSGYPDASGYRQSVDHGERQVYAQGTDHHNRGFAPGMAHQSQVAAADYDDGAFNNRVSLEKPFPPRKSSLSQAHLPASLAARNQASQLDMDTRIPAEDSYETEQETIQPLTFVRPADIYRRMEEEKEKQRQSMDSQRPSMDVGDLNHPSVSASAPQGANLLGNLQPVAERRSEYGWEDFVTPGGTIPADPDQSVQFARSLKNPPSLPQLNRVSGFDFGADMWKLDSPAPVLPESATVATSLEKSSITHPEVSSSAQPLAEQSMLHHEPSLGFRSAVDNAFKEHEPRASELTTPRSQQESQQDSDISRSNTDSTVGISPIMSRVPSAGTASRRLQERDDHVWVPATIEENTQTASPGSRPDSAETLRQMHDIRAGATGHAAKSSVESIPQDYQRESPAHMLSMRTEDLTTDAASGDIEVASPQQHDTISGQPGMTSPADAKYFQVREADLANAISSNPEHERAIIAEEARDAQNVFLQKHEQTNLLSDETLSSMANNTRPDSPSKGKVRDMASRFNEIEQDSRRNSFPVSRSPSPTKDTPRSTGLASYTSSTSEMRNIEHETVTNADVPNQSSGALELPQRPAMPGEWISYASTQQPLDERQSLEYDEDDDLETSSIMATPKGMRAQSPARTPDEEVDLAPNTKRTSLRGRDYTQAHAQSMQQLQAAGAAIGESLKSSMGFGGKFSSSQHNVIKSEDPAAEQRTIPTIAEPASDVAPLRMHHSTIADERSIASSVGPTPPPKDTPYQTSNGNAGYFSEAGRASGRDRDLLDNDSSLASGATRISVESALGDTENDKLSKEIVQSLTPRSIEDLSRGQSQLQAGALTPQESPGADSMRASTVIPREYDSYWATSTSQMRDMPSPTSPVPPTSQMPEGAHIMSSMKGGAPQPGMLATRFSWEAQDHAPAELPAKQAINTTDVGLGLDSTRVTQTGSSEVPGSPVFSKSESFRRLSDQRGSLDSHPALRSSNDISTPVIMQSTNIGRSSIEGARPSTSSTGNNFPGRPMSHSKLRPFREILAIKNTGARLEAYNTTYRDFATLPTGLDQWLSQMVNAHPEHTQGSASRPMVNTAGLSGSARSKFSPGSARLDTAGSSPGQQPYYQQYLDSAPQVSSSSPSATASASASSPMSRQDTSGKSRSTSAQMQLKGKDLLHSAGLMGGKGVSGAKGLFAKGKSRFKSATEKE